jgi:hypothetical protein
MVPVFADLPTASGKSTLNQSSYSAANLGTSAFTPPAGAVLLASVESSLTTGPGNVPTIPTDGVHTWTLINSMQFSTNATPTRTLALFRSLTDGTQYTGLTLDFAGQAQNGCAIEVTQATETLVTGANAADAIVQTKKTFSDTAGTSAFLSGVTALAAFATAENRTFVCVMVNGTETVVAGGSPAGNVLGTQQGYTSPAITGCAQWNPTTQDLSPAVTWTNAQRWGIIGCEIAATPPVGAQYQRSGLDGRHVYGPGPVRSN